MPRAGAEGGGQEETEDLNACESGGGKWLYMHLKVKKYCVDWGAEFSYKEVVKSSQDTLVWNANPLAEQFSSSHYTYTYSYIQSALF